MGVISPPPAGRFCSARCSAVSGVYVCMGVSMGGLRAGVSVGVGRCGCVCMCVCLHVCRYVCMWVCMYVGGLACMSLWLFGLFLNKYMSSLSLIHPVSPLTSLCFYLVSIYMSL
jgi:hypothetical protein